MEKIDYTKLNNQIVKQAYDNFILTNEKLQELYKSKFERAQAQVEAQKQQKQQQQQPKKPTKKGD